MSAKPRKVGEAKAVYAGKKPAAKSAGGRTEFQRISEKLLRERKDLLHKLAQ